MTKTYCRKWFYHGAIIRQRGNAYQAEINCNGQRHRSTLPSLAEAKTHIELKQVDLKNEGLAALVLTEKQKRTAELCAWLDEHGYQSVSRANTFVPSPVFFGLPESKA